MSLRTIALLTTVGLFGVAGPGIGASVRTANFIVETARQDDAEEFARLAEHYRRTKAMEWLGREMPKWRQPCRLRVNVTAQGAGGATTFDFGDANDIQQEMQIEGSRERLKHSVLPHEITHTVFAHHFRQPVPRWADEGGSVYSEDDLERTRHDKLCRQILNAGNGIQLKALFRLKDYPRDVMTLYAQGYSVTRYLVEQSDRQTFLNFVASGMQKGWDRAAQEYYNFRTVDELERAWIEYLKQGGGRGPATSPGNGGGAGSASALASGRAAPLSAGDGGKLTVYDSSPPVRPSFDPLPTSRGSSGGSGSAADRPTGDIGWNRPRARLLTPIADDRSAPVVLGPTPGSTTALPRPYTPAAVLLPPEPAPYR